MYLAREERNGIYFCDGSCLYATFRRLPIGTFYEGHVPNVVKE